MGTTAQVKTSKLDCNEEVLELQTDSGLTGWNLRGCGSLFLEPETSESISRAHVDSLDGMASTNSTTQVLFFNCYEIQILIQFFRSLKNSIIQVVCFNLREWYIHKWAASRQQPASIALFSFLKVTGDQILPLEGILLVHQKVVICEG